MNIFRELFTLCKMLTSGKIEDKEELVMYPMKHFPFKNYKYMMWCGNVIYREKYQQDCNMSDIERNHETIHLYQAKDKGGWFRYYLSYLFQWIKGIFCFCGWNGSYYTSKYEVEAYSKEKDMKYLERREKNMVDKFKIDNRRKTYKKNAISTFYFKEYLKSLFKEI